MLLIVLAVVDAMWFLAITSCLWIAGTTALAARRGLNACPRHWIPEGTDTNGCPLRCLNIATGEKLHLIVRYTLKSALLKGCVQCEERWIENTDCVKVLCPERSPGCSEEIHAKHGNASLFHLFAPEHNSERVRPMSLELFKKLYPTEIVARNFSRGGVIRLHVPSEVAHIPRYQSPDRFGSNGQNATSKSSNDGSEGYTSSKAAQHGGNLTESTSKLASVKINERISSSTEKSNSANYAGILPVYAASASMNTNSAEVPEISHDNDRNEYTKNGPMETTDISPLEIPPPAPGPRVKSHYRNYRKAEPKDQPTP